MGVVNQFSARLLIGLFTLLSASNAGPASSVACRTNSDLSGNISVSVTVSDTVSVRSLSFDGEARTVLQSVVHCSADDDVPCDPSSCQCPCSQPLLNSDGSYLDWISSYLVQCNATLLLIGLGLGELFANSAVRCGQDLQAAVALEADPTIAQLAGDFGYTRGATVIIEPDTSRAVQQLSRHQALPKFKLGVVDCFIGASVPASCRSESLMKGLRLISSTVVQNMYHDDCAALLVSYRQLWPYVITLDVQGNTLIVASTNRSIFQLQSTTQQNQHFLYGCVLLGLISALAASRVTGKCRSKQHE